VLDNLRENAPKSTQKRGIFEASCIFACGALFRGPGPKVAIFFKPRKQLQKVA
jgi:hypothetical protein